MKEGRRIKAGEQPMKLVKQRAVTINKVRAQEAAVAEGEEPIQQGLYAKWQTELVKPQPVKDVRSVAMSDVRSAVADVVHRARCHAMALATSTCLRLTWCLLAASISLVRRNGLCLCVPASHECTHRQRHRQGCEAARRRLCGGDRASLATLFDVQSPLTRAQTGFEFHKRRAVPVASGIIVPIEEAEAVLEVCCHIPFMRAACSDERTGLLGFRASCR